MNQRFSSYILPTAEILSNWWLSTLWVLMRCLLRLLFLVASQSHWEQGLRVCPVYYEPTAPYTPLRSGGAQEYLPEGWLVYIQGNFSRVGRPRYVGSGGALCIIPTTTQKLIFHNPYKPVTIKFKNRSTQTLDTLVHLQSQDPHIAHVKEKLINKEKCTTYCLKKNVVCKIKYQEESQILQLYVPSVLLYPIIVYIHKHFLHPTKSQMILEFDSMYFHPQSKKAIGKVCKACIPCATLIHASQCFHAVLASILGVRLGWLGRMPAH